MRSPRQLKVGEEIRHALAMMFQRGDVSWPRDFKPPMVTISEVQVSPDLRNASVFFTTLGDAQVNETRRVLMGMVGPLRFALGKAVRLRYVPTLSFKVDESFQYAEKIDRLLNDPAVAKDLASKDGEKIDVEDDQ